MSKSNLNKLCLCGSRRTTENCCGFSKVTQITPQIYNDELDELQHTLLNYALTNYEQIFTQQNELHFPPSLDDREKAIEFYLTGLTIWVILSVPVFNSFVIFDLFYKQYKGKIKHKRTKRKLLEWRNASPSIYEILSTDDDTQMVTVSDLLTNKTFQIPVIDGIPLSENDVLLGTLVPFVGYHRFLMDTLEIPSSHKGSILTVAEKFSQKEGQFQKSFPDFLAEILLAKQSLFEWENAAYEEVIQLFLNKMTKKDIHDEGTYMGIMIWRKHTELKNPEIEDPSAYAAALEYLMQTTLGNTSITQKEIAQAYDTTTETISVIEEKVITSIREYMTYVDYCNDLGLFNSDKESSLKTAQKVQKILSNASQTNGKKRNQLIEEALTIDPNNADAYLLLAEDADSEEVYEQLLQQAVFVGEKDLGKAFIFENKGRFWILPETRPYMRAKEKYANYFYQIGNNIEAVKHFSELLQLNPDDNQGIRYTLLTLYIETDELNEAIKLINKFNNEATANFLFNRVVIDYLINGFTSQTKQLIKEANKQNPFVKDYLFGNKEIPDQTFDYISCGDETEAIIYTQEHIHIWESIPGLLIELSK